MRILTKSVPVFFGVLFSVNGQDSNEITGNINDGGEKKAVTAPTPSYRIISSVTKTRKLRELTFRQVEAPEATEPLSLISPTAEAEEGKPNHSFVVSSVSYPGKGTKVRWWPTGQSEDNAHECWSNIDWRYLEGFHRFGSSSQSFTFMLLHQAAQELGDEVPPSLPSLTLGGRYMVTAGDEENDAAMDFIEGLHEVYDLRKEDLEAAAAKRETAAENRRMQKEQEAENPSVKKIEVRFWPLTAEQKTR